MRHASILQPDELYQLVQQIGSAPKAAARLKELGVRNPVTREPYTARHISRLITRSAGYKVIVEQKKAAERTYKKAMQKEKVMALETPLTDRICEVLLRHEEGLTLQQTAILVGEPLEAVRKAFVKLRKAERVRLAVTGNGVSLWSRA